MKAIKKSHILIGLLCAVLAIAVAITAFSLNRKNQPVTNQMVSIDTKKLSNQTDDRVADAPILDQQVSVEKIPTEDQVQIAATEETRPDELNDTDRFNDVLRLRNQPSEKTIQLLVNYLYDENIDIVAEAMDALAYVGMNSKFKEMVFDILKQKASDKDYPARGNALIAAARFDMDEQFLSILPGFLIEKGDQGEEDMTLALRALSFVKSPDLFPYLNQIIDQSQNQQNQKMAYGIMARYDSVESNQFLEDMLGSSNDENQKNSTWALSRANKPEQNLILEDALTQQQLKKESVALVAASPSAAEVFGNILNNDAIETDQKLYYLDVIAANTVNAGLKVRDDMKDALEPLLDSDNRELKLEAIRTLGKVGGDIEDTANLLEPELQSSDQEIKEQAFFSYSSYVSRKTYKPLLDLLWDDNEKIRRGAIAMAANYIDSSDTEQLMKALKHDDEFMREQAELILGKL
ncbi:HEAT repeat domain-containing protein [uncultured Desulfobacter sp.]|uniref:HEAT repeat domain-containing protein n=1 Tax=uncultured Desulfobacter sp. TaxID=240139 RepID=UPI0029F48729|nr:HEAT repeat domain-containing protein [uncultured Desulfobacter sp.]